MALPIYKDITAEQTKINSYAAMVSEQTIVEVPEYRLECGDTLKDFPVAFKTWGRLNKTKDNVLLICHALTGSADVQDWWGPLLGPGLTFDPSRFFIVCINFLGSPYGSCSPVTINKETGKPYGPDFPLVTIRDDIGIQRLILDSLGVSRIACVIGGSLGGMAALEYSSTYNKTGYVRAVVALATAARASAWCISWNETQRQCIFKDPDYIEGYYNEAGVKPDSGLSTARMAALLTYRSRNSFEARFARKSPVQNPKQKNLKKTIQSGKNMKMNSDPWKSRESRELRSSENWLIHNDGAQVNHVESISTTTQNKPQTSFTAQSYLRYQGEKFVSRFDANCYISISRKFDTHDITRGRVEENPQNDPLPAYLSTLTVPHLVIGIRSDGLFTYNEQQLLAQHLPNNVFHALDSPDGHDAFLLEFQSIDSYCKAFFREKIPQYFYTTISEPLKAHL